MPPDDPTPLAAFRAAFRRDVDSDSVRPLSEYLARFPGADDAIAREFLAAREATTPIGVDFDATEPTSAPRRDAAPSRAPAVARDDAADRLGPYRLLRELNRGGQGVVYLALDERVGRSVALKVLTDRSLNVPAAVERFRREATVASKLDHPGICPVFDVGLDGATPYLAMKLVKGEALAAKIATSRDRSNGASATKSTVVELATVEENSGESRGSKASAGSPPGAAAEIDRILKFVEDAARALHAAHEAGVVHRDVKPGNIMATPAGEPVLLDFGLARDDDADAPALTQTGDVLGTPLYMSPEQVAGPPIRLDRRTDVYSLGATLYECLTLRRPFEEPTRESLYRAILSKDPPDVRSLNPSISNDLRVVVEAAMEKDRDRRYATALDFAEELRRVRMREPIRAKPAGTLTKLVRWSQRRPALAAAVVGLFLALTTGLATSLHLLAKRDEALVERTAALDQATAERNAKQAALEAKSAALDDYDRLGDVSRLTRLLAEEAAFWPAEPSKIEEMRRWLDEARRLEANFESHRRTRDALRNSDEALPYSEADREKDAAIRRPFAERRTASLMSRAAVQTQLKKQEARAAASRPSDDVAAKESDTEAEATARSVLEGLRLSLKMLDADIAKSDAVLNARWTWRFKTESAQFKHDTFGKLAYDLESFLDPDPYRGAKASVERRLRFAERVEQETLLNYAKAWEEARASIADPAACPLYGGLDLKPQLGLIPIRRDPRSGLWEFAHYATTEEGADPVPALRADGRYDLKESTGLVFVLIPGGKFRMGARRPTAEELAAATTAKSLPPNVDPVAQPDEEPVHDVVLSPFFLSKYEMTQGQWFRAFGSNPATYRWGHEVGGRLLSLRHPVETVSWVDCVGETGLLLRLGLDLPTEAQWEYAARAGTTTPWWTGSKKESVADAANLADAYFKKNGGSPTWVYESWNDGYSVHAPVGSFAPNAFGVHDVLGNVHEWCRDGRGGYGPGSLRKGDGLRYAGPAPAVRMERGGSFRDEASEARSSIRGGAPPEGRTATLGVRPSRAIDP